MRKRTKRGVLLVALIAMLGCSDKDEIATPAPSQGTTLQAVTSQTRTTFDGTTSTWSTGDKLMVAIGASGETPTLQEFTLTNPQTGLFRNEHLSLNYSKSYDLFALYSSSNTHPDISNSQAMVQVGAATQEQNGTSAAHIAVLDPLYGSTTGAEADNLGVEMHHTAVALRIDVKNVTGAELAGIKSLQIIAPSGVKLSDECRIDFSQATTTVNPTSANDSNIITVNVANSPRVANNASFSVWAAATPFTISNGKSLVFRITTTDDKEFEYTKTFAADTSFEAGSIMHTTVETRSILIKWGYLDGFITPAPNMPSCKTDNLNDILTNSNVYKLNTTSGTYQTAYGDISIESDVKYAYVTSLGCIRFRNATSDKEALIKLPIINGYKLTKVYTHITKSQSETDRKIDISVISVGSSALDITQNTLRQTNTYYLSDKGTSSTTQYGIRITYVGSDKHSCDLTGIELFYELEQ